MVTMTISGCTWARIERLVAALTIGNGALGLVMWVTGLLSRGAIGSLPLLALLGLLSGVLAWRGRLGGHGAGLVFYGVQLAAFHSWDSTQAYHLTWTFSLAFVVHLPTGLLLVNAFAVAMLAASAALLWRRCRTAWTVTAR
jgi:hypothetical protein